MKISTKIALWVAAVILGIVAAISPVAFGQPVTPGGVSAGTPVVGTTGTFSGNVTGTSFTATGTLQGAQINLGGVSASASCIGASSSDQICVTPNSMSITATGGVHFGGGVDLTSLAGTPGSGTGITAGTPTMVRHWAEKQTVINTALTAAASTDVTIWTTLTNTRLLRVSADVTQVFTGGALSAMTVQCGSAAGGTQYLLAGSVFAATTTLGDVAAEIGAGLLSATVADMGTPAAGIPGAIAISCRFTCTGANCNAATQGSVTFEIEGVTYP